MKKVFLAFLFLTFLSSKCGDKYLKCSNCYDRESVLKEATRIAEKRFGKIDNCEIIVVNEADLKDANRMAELDEQLIDRCEILIIDKMDFYTIFYSRNDFSSFGGGFWMEISKKDCKIVDYKISK